jgi:ABC-2 type transport system ATP-binding protein
MIAMEETTPAALPSAPDDISITGVTKIFSTGIFRRKVGVVDLDLGISRGEVVGLLGANGSGKSTTIKMILGFIKPTRGEILVGGHPAGSRAARALIGYLPENPRFQRFLRAREVLSYYGSLLGLNARRLSPRIDYLLRLVGLQTAARERIQGFSKGMVQRLAIAQALLGEPKLLILDEPMSGLDPLGRIEIRQLIQRIHQELAQTTIFFSTHILYDAQELCTSVAILKKGRLQRQCRIDELLGNEAHTYHLTVRGISTIAIQRHAQASAPIQNTPLGLSFYVEGTQALVSCLTDLKREGGTLVGIQSEQRSLEEALYSDLKEPAVSAPGGGRI